MIFGFYFLTAFFFLLIYGFIVRFIYKKISKKWLKNLVLVITFILPFSDRIFIYSLGYYQLSQTPKISEVKFKYPISVFFNDEVVDTNSLLSYFGISNHFYFIFNKYIDKVAFKDSNNTINSYKFSNLELAKYEKNIDECKKERIGIVDNYEPCLELSKAEPNVKKLILSSEKEITDLKTQIDYIYNEKQQETKFLIIKDILITKASNGELVSIKREIYSKHDFWLLYGSYEMTQALSIGIEIKILENNNIAVELNETLVKKSKIKGKKWEIKLVALN